MPHSTNFLFIFLYAVDGIVCVCKFRYSHLRLSVLQDFQIKMPNMLGRGEQLSLVYTLGTRISQYSASFKKPLNNDPDFL